MDVVGDILLALVARARADADLPTLLCEEAAATLPVSGASLAVMTPEGTRATVAATDAAAGAVADAQVVTGEGPCVESFRTGRLVLVGDLRATWSTWPAFGPLVDAASVRAVFAFPVQIGGIRLGVFELHRSEPGPLDDAALTRSLHFVDAAALVLMHGAELSLRDADNPVDLGGYAVDAVVHQATGMVSVQASVGLAAALVMLRARAFAEGRPVRKVAADVVGRVVRFSPPGDEDEVRG